MLPTSPAQPLPSRFKAALVALIFFLLGGWICLEAVQVPVGSLNMPGAGFFPLLLGVLLCLLACLLFVVNLRSPAAVFPRLRPEQPEVYTLTATMLAAVWLFERAGFLLTTTLFLLVMLKTLGKLGWPATVGVAVLTSLGSYLLFERVLMIALPTGILPL